MPINGAAGRSQQIIRRPAAICATAQYTLKVIDCTTIFRLAENGSASQAAVLYIVQREAQVVAHFAHHSESCHHGDRRRSPQARRQGRPTILLSQHRARLVSRFDKRGVA